MDDIAGLSPRRLAGIVERVYGSRLTDQEALLFYAIVRSGGFITYTEIENYLWAGGREPAWPRRAIQVVVCGLRRKIPALRAEAKDGQGYTCTVDLVDVSPEAQS